MRLTAVLLIGVLAIVAARAISASAAPMAASLDSQARSNIVRVWGGCGWGFHPGYWGGCVPNHYGYYAPYWRRHYYWKHRYYGGGYYPYWRHRYYYGY